MEFKQQGNKLYAQKKFKEAIAAYTKGIDLLTAVAEEGGEADSTATSTTTTTTTTAPLEEGLSPGPAASALCLSQLYSNRSMLYLDDALVDEATQDAELAVEADPTNAKAYLRRAAVHLDLFDGTEALKDLAKVAELDPNIDVEVPCLRAKGKKWVPNCYLKKRLSLQKKLKCDYVLMFEYKGEEVVESVKLDVVMKICESASGAAPAKKDTSPHIEKAVASAASDKTRPGKGDLASLLLLLMGVGCTPGSLVERITRDEDALDSSSDAGEGAASGEEAKTAVLGKKHKKGRTFHALLVGQIRREYGPDFQLEHDEVPAGRSGGSRSWTSEYNIFHAVMRALGEEVPPISEQAKLQKMTVEQFGDYEAEVATAAAQGATAEELASKRATTAAKEAQFGQWIRQCNLMKRRQLAGISPIEDAPILFPGAPAWLDAQFDRSLFLTAMQHEHQKKKDSGETERIEKILRSVAHGCPALADHIRKPGFKVPEEEPYIPPTADSLAKHTKAMIEYRRAKFGDPKTRVKKCHGCQKDLSSDPDPQECICGEMYCSFECHENDWSRSHQRACYQVQEVCVYTLRITKRYWDMVSLGWFPLKDEPFFTDLWKDRGIDESNTEDVFEAEVEYHYKNEIEELTLQQVTAQQSVSRVEVNRGFRLMHELFGKWTRRLANPLPTDSPARLKAKLRVCGHLANLATDIEPITFHRFYICRDMRGLGVHFLEQFSSLLPQLRKYPNISPSAAAAFPEGLIPLVVWIKFRTERTPPLSSSSSSDVRSPPPSSFTLKFLCTEGLAFIDEARANAKKKREASAFLPPICIPAPIYM